MLDVPAELLTNLELAQGVNKFESFASDLMSIALWGGAQPTTVAALAERALASEDEVRQTVQHAVRRDLLAVEGDLTGEFSLTARSIG